MENISQRSIFIKNFWFQCGDTAKAVAKNCEDLDNIDISEVLELNPNRALEVLYSEAVLEMNDINPRSFFVEEENGEKYFLDKKYYNKKTFQSYVNKMKITSQFYTWREQARQGAKAALNQPVGRKGRSPRDAAVERLTAERDCLRAVVAEITAENLDLRKNG